MELLIAAQIMGFPLTLLALLTILPALTTKKKLSDEKRVGADQDADVKPVENEEVFDHLFLQNYRELTILGKKAA